MNFTKNNFNKFLKYSFRTSNYEVVRRTVLQGKLKMERGTERD